MVLMGNGGQVVPASSDFWFLPLGGTGEIGMNMNLYGHAGQWLMVDCGVSFDEPLNPDVAGAVKHEVVAPDPKFITDNLDLLAGLIITHAHEDHIGAVEDLWLRLKCPIYTTPYTAAVLRRKLSYTNFADKVRIIEVNDGETVTIGAFQATWIRLTHSLPDPYGILLETPAARVVHTGDWKIDRDPVIGAPIDASALQQLANIPIDAVVGDSTNALKPGWSVSEAECFEGLLAETKGCEGRVVVGCFSSNIARLVTLAKVAERAGRRMAVFGRSLERHVATARAFGLWPDDLELITHQHVGYLPPHEVMVVATGCQGEPRAALSRLADDSHPMLAMDRGDTVILSAMVIPGNEVPIDTMKQKFSARDIHVVQKDDTALPIHASGHPNQEELKQLYRWLTPALVIPTHGESQHLKRHAEIAREIGIKRTLTGVNGDLFRIAPIPSIRRKAVSTGRIPIARS